MDPQGLLNMADQEDEAGDHDATKGGDVHAGTHAVSLSHEGSSEAGSGSKSSEETADPGEDQNKMDVETPSFRIVDIEAPAASATTTPSLNALTADGSARLGPDPVPLAVLPATPHVQPSGFDFAVPATPTGSHDKERSVAGKHIFATAGRCANTGPTNFASVSAVNSVSTDPKSNYSNAAMNPEKRKIPSGVKKPSEKNTLPPKKPVETEPDAVPSKIYEAIIENKKKKEKAGTIGGIASGQGPTECGSFFNKGDNRILRTVYKEDVSSLSVSSMSLNPVTWKCSVCPSAHSVFDANEKGGRCVIVLVDQNFPAVLPSSENRCLAIIRLDQGSLDDLIDLFVNITRQVTVPPGSVVLFGSLTSLSKVGLQSYASACINGKRRISGVAKKCEVIPFIPPPWEAAMIRN
jgi:hypothetical protein